MKIKTLLTIIFILLIMLVCSVGVLKLNQKKVAYEERIEADENRINSLQSELDSIGDMVTVYQTAYDVKSGTEVKEVDLIAVEIPVKVAGTYIQDPSEIVGSYYKLDITAETPLLQSMVFPFEVKEDMRYLDVTCDEIPIGLEIDDYVDLRISFTFGQDFIGMTHKRVAAIYGKTLKLIVDQKDVYTYESMKVDKSIYEGTKLYSIEYLEGGTQTEANNYYPMRTEVLATLVQDPNIKTDLTSLTIVNRTFLEKQLMNVDLVKSVADSKRGLLSAFDDANDIYSDIVKDAQKAAEDEAKRVAQEAERAATEAARAAEEAAQEINAAN